MAAMVGGRGSSSSDAEEQQAIGDLATSFGAVEERRARTRALRFSILMQHYRVHRTTVSRSSRRAARVGRLAIALAMLVGCVGDLRSSEAPTRDAAPATRDAGGVPDAGADATSGLDAGSIAPPDAAPRDDAGLDADVDADVDAGVDAGPPRPRRVLIFTRTRGFRHRSIEPGRAALASALDALGLASEQTESLEPFTDADLARFSTVVFLNTSGDVLGPPQEAALQRWVEAGGGWVGVHAAADTEYDWPWYRNLVGAWVHSHPAIQSATVAVEDGTHAATRHLPARWTRTDEWYDFRSNPRGEVAVQLTLDESTYSGGRMGADHPIAWSRDVGAGRSFYTAGGHTEGAFMEPLFMEHLTRAIRWAGRLE